MKVGDYYRATDGVRHVAVRIDEIREDGEVFWSKWTFVDDAARFRTPMDALESALADAEAVPMTVDEAKVWPTHVVPEVPR